MNTEEIFNLMQEDVQKLISAGVDVVPTVNIKTWLDQKKTLLTKDIPPPLRSKNIELKLAVG